MDHNVWKDEYIWEMIIIKKIRDELSRTIQVDDKSEAETLKRDAIFSTLGSM